MTQDWEGGSLEESGKLDEPSYRCEHNTYTGDPYGPDYMCFYCEMGYTKEDMQAERRWELQKKAHRVAARRLADHLGQMQWHGRDTFADGLMVRVLVSRALAHSKLGHN